MDLTALLNNKKFRGCGNREGAIRVFQLLQQDKLGQLEARRGRNSKVSFQSMHFTAQNQLTLMLLQVATAILVASSTLPFGYLGRLRLHPPARTQASFKAPGCSYNCKQLTYGSFQLTHMSRDDHTTVVRIFVGLPASCEV